MVPLEHDRTCRRDNGRSKATGSDGQTAPRLSGRCRQEPCHAVGRWQSSHSARALCDACGVAGPPGRARRPLEAHRSVAERARWGVFLSSRLANGGVQPPLLQLPSPPSCSSDVEPCCSAKPRRVGFVWRACVGRWIERLQWRGLPSPQLAAWCGMFRQSRLSSRRQ